MSELQYDNRGNLSRKERQTSLRIEEGLKSQVEKLRLPTGENTKVWTKLIDPFCYLGWAVYKGKMESLEKPNVREP